MIRLSKVSKHYAGERGVTALQQMDLDGVELTGVSDDELTSVIEDFS